MSGNTLVAYQRGMQCFLTFLIMSGVIIESGQLPVISENLLIFFCYYDMSLKLKWTTIKQYLAGIRYHHLRAGFSNPLQKVDRLQCVLRGVKRTQCSKVKPRFPITIQLLDQICRLLKIGVFSPHIDNMK